MKPELRIFKDLEELSHAAVHLFVEQATDAVAERDRFLVALNGGNTPSRLFQLLATDYDKEVDWSKVHVFWGDERCVPVDDLGAASQAARSVVESCSIPDRTSPHHRVGTHDASRNSSRCRNFLSPPPLDLVDPGMGTDIQHRFSWLARGCF
jgi:6-phosphogluconolactonase